MKTVFACTFIEKRVEKDTFNEGCDPKTAHVTMAQAVNIRADTLPKLFELIGKEYGLDINDVFIPDDADSGTTGAAQPVTYCGFNRHEVDDGSEPSAHEKIQFEAGLAVLWVADYTFSIEKITVAPVLVSDFKDANIKFH